MRTINKRIDGDSIVGREHMVQAILDLIREGKNVLLVGPEGVGKTAMMKCLFKVSATIRDVPWFIYCGDTNTLKGTLQQMAATLLTEYHDLQLADLSCSTIQDFTPRAVSKLLTNARLLALKKAVVRGLRSRRYALILDHLSAVRSPCASFLEFLIMECHVPLIGAVRELHYKRIGRLNDFLWAFTKISVENLDRGSARMLIERCLKEHRVDPPDRPGFTTELLRLSGGNPKIIARVCAVAGDVRYLHRHRVNVRLIMLDLNIQTLVERSPDEDNELFRRS